VAVADARAADAASLAPSSTQRSPLAPAAVRDRVWRLLVGGRLVEPAAGRYAQTLDPATPSRTSACAANPSESPAAVT
jgi:hypothetical protein